MADLYKIVDSRNPSAMGDIAAVGDVVFIHGLDGDAFKTWSAGDGQGETWPKWLKEDLPKAEVWTLGYDVRSSRWWGWSMPLYDRAKNVVNRLTQFGIGSRPIVFICHSMGGLLVKQVLRSCSESNVEEQKAIAANTRGIVFLATPHLGSRLADLVLRIPFYAPTSAVTDLQFNASRLRELNSWYRNHYCRLNIKNSVWIETRSLFGIKVVDEISGDPGLPDEDAVPLDNQHVDITKPRARWDQQYIGVEEFVAKCLTITAPSPVDKPHPSPDDPQKPFGVKHVLLGLCLALAASATVWFLFPKDPCQEPPDPAAIAESIRKDFALKEGVPPNSLEDGTVNESRLVRAIFMSLPLSHGDLKAVEEAIRSLDSRGEYLKEGAKDVHLEPVVKRLPQILEARLSWLRDEVLPSLSKTQSDEFELPSMAYVDPSRGRTKVTITRDDAREQVRCLEKSSSKSDSSQ